MPQMSPLFWMLLMFMFFSNLIMMMIMIYFYIYPWSFLNITNKKYFMKFNLKW